MHARLLTLAAVVALGGSAAADEPDYEAAMQHYAAGDEARTAGNYDLAVQEYLKAYEITKDTSIFKQVAKSYEGGGKRADAVTYYRRYLAESKKLSADEKAATEAKIKELESSDVLNPDDTLEPGTDTGTAPSFSEGGSRGMRTAAWVSVGVAAVFLATGGVLGMSAMSREEDIQRLVNFRDVDTGLPKEYTGTVKADYEDKVDEGEKLEKYSQYALIGAGVAAGAAVIFFVLDASSSDKPAHAENNAVGLRVHLLPDAAGVSAGWEF